MATSQSTADYILDQLVSLDRIAVRKMFGEYALYCNGKVVALICDNTLFVKITEQGKAFVGKKYEEGFAYPGAKPSMLIDEGLIENCEWLSKLIQITEEHLPKAKAKKRKT
jgi:TfoX/Sxy family transcriptional regulator of competence genes